MSADIPAIVDAVSRVGFPSAVAAFVLLRVERTLRDLVSETRSFREAMTATLVGSTTQLEQHITARSEHIIHEMQHDTRAALGALPFRKEAER